MTEETVPAPAPAPPPAPARPPSPARDIVWALISTALLAGWIGLNMGWLAAVALVFGVFVHEFGHVLAINALGCGPGRMQIVPFLGGAAYPARLPDTEFKGVLIALAGPVFGLVALSPFLVAFAATGQERWLGAAFLIAVINLINLAPAPPLDGSKAFGPALARIHPALERAALLVVGGLAVFWAVTRGSWIFAVFVGLGVLGALQRGRLRPWTRELTGAEWAGAVLLYAGSVALCLAAVAFTADPAVLGGLRRLTGLR